MGMMVEGIWHDADTGEIEKSGHFVRKESYFRNWVTPDGNPGPSGKGGFPAESGRYHLYVAYSCPWAHRAVIYRSIMGLQDAIGMSVVHPISGENGWEFADYPCATGDKVSGARYLRELYARAEPAYTGKVTVPVLWDRETNTIVNNESAEIIRMIGDAFRSIAPNPLDFYPEQLSTSIDELNEFIYVTLNNGVYRCGFARSQAAYEESVGALFAALDDLDERLKDSRYLFGDKIVETDWRLFTTLIRFDPVYYFHFKCNMRPLPSYANIVRYMRDLLRFPGIRETLFIDHINAHYYVGQTRINPSRIIPIGAGGDFNGPIWADVMSEETVVC